MVFSWLFGEKKRQEPGDAAALLTRADEATTARDVLRAESLCRELIKQAPDNPDAWNMLGVNLIRRDVAAPDVRAEAVVAWMRALALRPGDSRAADHLQTEMQFADELVPELVRKLSAPAPTGDDAAAALAQIGLKAKDALAHAAQGEGAAAQRARSLLASL